MKQLSGMDSIFLDIETNACPTHIGAVMILAAGESGEKPTYQDVVALLRSRLHLAPQFRRRLIPAPLGLDQPYWIEDPEFELENHVHHRALPAPGTEQQLETVVCDVMSQRLDRSRPLWEYHYIEGLEDDRVAVLSKIHHAYIDGVSGAQLLASMLDLSPARRLVDAEDDGWEPDPLPRPAELLARTALGLVRRPRIGARALAGSVKAAFHRNSADLARRQLGAGLGGKRNSKSAPRTIFNTRITARRSFAFRSLSLDDVKFIKNTYECTVNDVVMTVCGEGLRRYLEGHGQLPAKSLIAGVPMSVRKPGQRGGNQVTMVRAALHTEIADPVARLEAIRNEMHKVKRRRGGIGANVLMDWTRFSSPALLGGAARLYEHFNVTDLHKPTHNVEVSNVPGSPQPLYFAGAPVKACFPVNIPYHGLGLVITLMSYMHQLDFGLTAHRDTVPDIWRLMDLIEEALSDLRERAAADSGAIVERSEVV